MLNKSPKWLNTWARGTENVAYMIHLKATTGYDNNIDRVTRKYLNSETTST